MRNVSSGEQGPTALADRIVKTGLVLLVFTVPLVFTTLAEKAATPPKIAWAQTIILFLGVLWFAKMNAQAEFVFHATALFWALVIYLVAQAVSLLKATNVGYGYFELRVFLFWFIAYVLVAHHVTERDIRRMLGAIILAGAFGSIYGILQSYGIDFVDWGVRDVSVDALTVFEKIRLRKTVDVLREGSSTFGHPNFAAHFLIIAIPLAAAMILTARRWQTRILYAIPLLLMVWHLNVTTCRGAMVGLGAGILVCISLVLGRLVGLSRSGEFKRLTFQQTLWMRRVFVIAVIIGGIGVGVVFTGKGIAMLEQFRKGVDSPYVARINTWRSSFRAFLNSPVFGFGKGSFEIESPPYWTEDERTLYARNREKAVQVHNEYLEIAFETGLVGLGAFVWFLICLWSRSLSVWRKELAGERRTILLCIVCAFTAVLVHSLVSFNLQTPASALSFFVLVGVVDVLGLEHEPRSIAVSLRRRGLSIVRRAVWVLLLFCVVTGLSSIARPFLARVRIMSGSLAMDRGNSKEGARQFESAARLAPWNWTASFGLGKAYVAVQEYDKAARQLEEALAANPNHVLIHTTAGFTYFNLGDIEKALESARTVISLVPEFPTGHYVIGLCYASQGRWEEALEELEAATLVPKSDRGQLYRNMAVCHYKLGQHNEAVMAFERAIAASPAADPELHVEKGELLLELKEYQKAAESLAEGMKLFEQKGVQLGTNRSMVKGYYLLARTALEGLDDPYSSSALLVELSRTVPQDMLVRMLTDKLFTYLARQDFSREGISAAWYHVGGAYLHQERYGEAEESLTVLVNSGETNVNILQRAYYDLALAISKKKDYERALRVLDKGKRIAPDFSPLDELKAEILSQKMSPEQTNQS